MMEGGGETRSYVLLNIMLLCITIFNDNGLLLITSWIKYLQHFDHILEITKMWLKQLLPTTVTVQGLLLERKELPLFSLVLLNHNQKSCDWMLHCDWSHAVTAVTSMCVSRSLLSLQCQHDYKLKSTYKLSTQLQSLYWPLSASG